MTVKQMLERPRTAARELNNIDAATINSVLVEVANRAEHQCDQLIAQNRADLVQMEPQNPMYDRLMLTPERIAGIAQSIRNIALLHSPVGEVIDSWVRPNGMIISKVRVPFGVIGAIYEARPNVSFDLFALCFKTLNAVVLKGGSDARHSNAAIVELIQGVLIDNGLNPNIVTLLPPDRSATAELLQARGLVDLIIPRGSASLISYVRENAHIPVIETGAGICHTYFDLSGDTAKGADIIFNAKTRRVSVCNALDTLIVHSERLNDLGTLCKKLATKNVHIFADSAALESLKVSYAAHLLSPANDDSFGTEFLDYKMAVKTVSSIEQAIDHIAAHTSGHSEAIITEDITSATYFEQRVDAACVYVNVSTAFTDGGEFGFGAEVGISTQKLHARGPMGLPELTSYKYIVVGNGQTR